MDARTVADVEGWESRPFGGGYDGLRDLAEGEFSGCVVVRDGGSYLFMVRGRVVGVFDIAESATGDPSVDPAPIDRFEDADGSAYEAPHDALALLFAMAASGGETRGRYYSQNTPLEEVDRTLQDGGFTGYLELSENVLSGDYYLVYHGGRRRSVAFVGQSRRLKTDEEAFDLASDEVGIYEVNAVGLSTVEIPGSSGSNSNVVPDLGDSPGREASEDEPTDADADDAGEAGEAGAVDDAEEGGGSRSRPLDTGAPGAVAGVDGPEEDPSDDAPETAEAGDTTSDRPKIDLDAAMRPNESDDATSPDPDAAADSAEPTDTDPTDGTEGSDVTGADDETGDPRSVDEDELADALAEDASGDPDDGPDAVDDSSGSGESDDTDDTNGDESGEAEPESETGTGDGTVASASAATEGETTTRDDQPSDQTDETMPEDVEAAAATAEPGADAEEGSGVGANGSASEGGPAGSTSEPGPTTDGVENARVVPSVDPARTERAEVVPSGPERASPDRAMLDGETLAGLRSELSDRESRIEELRERLSAVRTERDDLAERVDRLEERLAESGTAPLENTREVSPAEALSGTSVLVRYRSKTGPTLDAVHEGETDREALAGNLVLEPHPTFDTEGVAVSGLTFEAFVEGSQAYRFLRWLVGEFPFEVRETEHVAALEPLYAALPTLDRVEFDATVTLAGADRETTRFDLVGRDRRGNPLLVAHLEDDRAPTEGRTMEEFVTEATAAAESHDTLVAAFAVTASYFEPAALTTAEEVTGGSLLSRSRRKSFVKTSRKGGYHLCLVEDREESFYLSVPEL